jgi:hypothetical protein
VQGVEELTRRPADFAARVGQAIAAGAGGLPALTGMIEETTGLLKA